MTIIDVFKSKAFNAFRNSEILLSENGSDNRELAISWYGEGVGIIKAAHALLGTSIDTHNLEVMRDRISDQLWPGQNAL